MKLAGTLFLLGIICGGWLQELGFDKRVTSYQVERAAKTDRLSVVVN